MFFPFYTHTYQQITWHELDKCGDSILPINVESVKMKQVGSSYQS